MRREGDLPVLKVNVALFAVDVKTFLSALTLQLIFKKARRQGVL
jgi:hypothetical protein